MQRIVTSSLSALADPTPLSFFCYTTFCYRLYVALSAHDVLTPANPYPVAATFMTADGKVEAVSSVPSNVNLETTCQSLRFLNVILVDSRPLVLHVIYLLESDPDCHKTNVPMAASTIRSLCAISGSTPDIIPKSRSLAIGIRVWFTAVPLSFHSPISAHLEPHTL
jgi:hypothetical protein